MESSSRILVVDDDPSGRATVEALLFGRGYELEFASSGIEALVKASQQAPDLVLLDVMMPDIDGFEVCERLRSDSRLAQIPVIMVTALDDRDSRLRGISAGADDFVTKPIDGAELRARVKAITQLNRYRRLLAEQARFQWVVEQASDGYVMIDADDRIQYANPQARLYLGLAQSGELAQGASHPPFFAEVVRRQYCCEPAEAWADWPLVSGALQPGRYLVRPESSTARSFWLEVDLLDPASHQSADRLVHLRDITFHPHRTPTIEVEITPAGDGYLVLRVSDDGIVLSPEQLGQIWRPYYQGEKYFTGQAAGMGLGMATVSALVWEAAGQCHASGRENGPGLVIDLRLPMCWTGDRL